MYLAFNELCIHEEIRRTGDIPEARQRMNEFIQLLHRLKTGKVCDGLVCTHDIHAFRFCAGYGVAEWLKDPQVDRTYQQFFRTLYSKNCSYIDAADFEGEFRTEIDGKDYGGAGNTYAAETERITVSILTNPYFQQKDLWGRYLKIEDASEITETQMSIRNLSAGMSVGEMEGDIRRSCFEHISSGQDLWEQREVLFPNLIFCENVKDQLYKDPEKFHILQIMDRLQRVQEYFQCYDGVYNRKDLGMYAHSESETVRMNEQLKRMRLFQKPDGGTEYFFEHIRFSGKFSGGRIYLLPDDAARKCYIGYIGRHLPTKLF